MGSIVRKLFYENVICVYVPIYLLLAGCFSFYRQLIIMSNMPIELKIKQSCNKWCRRSKSPKYNKYLNRVNAIWYKVILFDQN